MSASITINSSSFSIVNKPEFRAQPEKEFEHRLQTRAHLTYLQDEQLFDVRDPRWGKRTIDGEVCYAHAFEGGLLIVKLETADGKMNLTHNEDGTFDRHLMDNPGQETVYSITSKNNGMESTHTFNAMNAGMASIPILCLCVAMTVVLATGLAAAQAAVAAGTAVAALFGINVTVFPAVGIVIAVLAFIGVWIVYAIGREIVLNLIYENRSTNKTLTLVDHYVFNIGDNPLPPRPLKPLSQKGGGEVYDDVVVNIDNVDKFEGVGVSMKFQKEDGTSLVICIRQDIYKDPHYTIKSFPTGDKTSAEQVYNDCTSGGLVTKDIPWGDLVVKNCVDPKGFNQYKFAGIFSFNDLA
jgi:hypothetical protein